MNPVDHVECPRAVFEAGGRLVNAEDAIGEIVGRNVVDPLRGTTTMPTQTPSEPGEAGTGRATSDTTTKTGSSTSPVVSASGYASTPRTSPPFRSNASRRATPRPRCSGVRGSRRGTRTTKSWLPSSSLMAQSSTPPRLPDSSTISPPRHEVGAALRPDHHAAGRGDEQDRQGRPPPRALEHCRPGLLEAGAARAYRPFTHQDLTQLEERFAQYGRSSAPLKRKRRPTRRCPSWPSISKGESTGCDPYRLMTKVKRLVTSSLGWLKSLTWIVTVYVPDPRGVPANTPVVRFRLSPRGRCPCVQR